MAPILKSFLSWVGGKQALRKFLYQLFPNRFSKYVEVFGGGGWVLFGQRQRPGCMEVYNDRNGDLVNLFFCVKNRTMALLLELGFLPLNGRDEFKVLRKFLGKEEFTSDYLRENLDLAKRELPPPSYEEVRTIMTAQAELANVRRAAAYYKSIRYSYASGGTSYGARGQDIRDFFGLIWECSRRLAKVVIEHKDFEAVIRTYDGPETMFYCDPPYYEAECYEVAFAMEDHLRLRKVLGECEGMWMLSYNDCPFIRELYAGCYMQAVTRLDNMAQRYEGGKEYAELIITSYDPADFLKEEQLTLFGSPEEYELETT